MQAKNANKEYRHLTHGELDRTAQLLWGARSADEHLAYVRLQSQAAAQQNSRYIDKRTGATPEAGAGYTGEGAKAEGKSRGSKGQRSPAAASSSSREKDPDDNTPEELPATDTSVSAGRSRRSRAAPQSYAEDNIDEDGVPLGPGSRVDWDVEISMEHASDHEGGDSDYDSSSSSSDDDAYDGPYGYGASVGVKRAAALSRPAASIARGTTAARGHSSRVFTPEKDKSIIELRADGVSWPAIAAQLGIPATAGGRPGGKQVASRYRTTLNPSLRRKGTPFTSEEDATIRAAVQAAGGAGRVQWTQLGRNMGRGGRSVRSRYITTLDPNITHGHFSPEDDATIRAAVQAAGGVGLVQWTQLGQNMGRRGRSVRTRYFKVIAKK